MTLLYAREKNSETREYEVINQEDAKAQGWAQYDVDFDMNTLKWYLSGNLPEPPALTHDEISELRKKYREENIDDLTARRSRKQALNDWTDEDEVAYIATAKAVEEYIAENFPYPAETTSDDMQSSNVSAEKPDVTETIFGDNDIKDEKPE